MSREDLTSVILPCVKGEVRRTFTHMAIDGLRTLAEADLVVTQDGWVVKDRFGQGNRWATNTEMTSAREGSA